MDLEDPTLKDIAKEFVTPGYMERARQRGRASKTGWDLLFFPINWALVGVYSYSFIEAALWLHRFVHPRSADFAPGPHPITLSETLIGLPPIFAAIPLGLMTGNILMWLLPAARRAHEAKADQPGWVSFRGAQRGLFKLAQLLVPLGLGAALIGALL